MTTIFSSITNFVSTHSTEIVQGLNTLTHVVVGDYNKAAHAALTGIIQASDAEFIEGIGESLQETETQKQNRQVKNMIGKVLQSDLSAGMRAQLTIDLLSMVEAGVETETEAAQ